jgi:HAD superfamily hydrolase (TIGR01509 family)
MYDLVIFDCDGVLVDSEVLAAQAESEVFRARGFDLSPERVLEVMVGKSEASMADWILHEYGRPLPDDFFQAYRVHREALFADALMPIAGVAGAIRALTQPVCVGSNSPAHRIAHSLSVTGLDGLFGPHVFSADHVARPKPAPDLFLHAARSMGVAPDRCLVVEDSLTGATAARDAGMACLGFLGGGHIRPGHGQALRHLGVRATFADMVDLPGLVRAPASTAVEVR